MTNFICKNCKNNIISSQFSFCSTCWFKLPYELREDLLRGERMRNGIKLASHMEILEEAIILLKNYANDR